VSQWSFEKGESGYKIKSRATGLHMSILLKDSVQEGAALRARAGALEFEVYCNKEGYFRYVLPICVFFGNAGT
jgi:hypothetical protein